MGSYPCQRLDEVKAKIGASDVHYDLLGFTLTIDGQAASLPYDAIRAMSYLLSNLENDFVNLKRCRLAAERGSY